MKKLIIPLLFALCLTACNGLDYCCTPSFFTFTDGGTAVTAVTLGGNADDNVTVDLDCPMPWLITDTGKIPAWLDVTPANGNGGSTAIAFTANEDNTTGAPRSFTLTFLAANGSGSAFTVTQLEYIDPYPWFHDYDYDTDNLFKITTPAEMEEFARVVNNGVADFSGKTVQLMNNINLSDYGYGATGFNNGKGWISIGLSSSIYFGGTFDGGERTISGLYINSTVGYTGLFGYVYGGTVKNLAVEIDANGITGGNFTGGIAGYINNGSKIENCSVTGGTITGYDNVGGVAGTITGSSSVENCYATVAVSGNNRVGGVAGYVVLGSVTNCYATGAVSGNNMVGGVAGNVSNIAKNCVALNESVKLNAGSTGSNVGRVAGLRGIGSLTNNAAWRGIDGTWSNKDLTDLDGADMKYRNIITDGTLGSRFLDAGGIWTTLAGDLPGLFGNTVPMPAHIKPKPYTGWYANTPTSFDIYDADELAGLAQLVNDKTDNFSGKTINLQNDIDLSDYGYGATEWNGGNGWIPIGFINNNTDNFNGTFDGGGNKISGLYIDRTGDFTGLFGRVDDGTIENLAVEIDPNGITGSANFVGGIAGRFTKGALKNNSVTGGAVSGYDYVGGVAGCIGTGSPGVIGDISNCYTTVEVSGVWGVGGVVGYMYDNCSVTNCYATGAVSGSNNVGGVAGCIQGGSSGTLQNCVALNLSVTGITHFGRVVGDRISGTLSNAAWEDMPVNGSALATGSLANSIDGADVTKGDAKMQVFYTGTLLWDFTSASAPWKWGDALYPLPVLAWQTVYPALPLHLQ